MNILLECNPVLAMALGAQVVPDRVVAAMPRHGYFPFLPGHITIPCGRAILVWKIDPDAWRNA